MLNNPQKRRLKAAAHDKKPIVTVGSNGLSEALFAELEVALQAHELVKIRVNADSREMRQQRIAELAERSSSELVQQVGHVATLYRRRKKDADASTAKKALKKRSKRLSSKGNAESAGNR